MVVIVSSSLEMVFLCFYYVLLNNVSNLGLVFRRLTGLCLYWVYSLAGSILSPLRNMVTLFTKTMSVVGDFRLY
jgi:hypothetical protein